MDWRNEINDILGEPTILDKLNDFFGTNFALEEFEQLGSDIVRLCSYKFIMMLVANVVEASMPLSDESYGRSLLMIFQLGMLCGHLSRFKSYG